MKISTFLKQETQKISVAFWQVAYCSDIWFSRAGTSNIAIHLE